MTMTSEFRELDITELATVSGGDCPASGVARAQCEHPTIAATLATAIMQGAVQGGTGGGSKPWQGVP